MPLAAVLCVNAPRFAHGVLLPFRRPGLGKHVFDGNLRAGILPQPLQFLLQFVHDHEHFAGFEVEIVAVFRAD